MVWPNHPHPHPHAEIDLGGTSGREDMAIATRHMAW
jgi:hypothetical protein